MTDHALDLTAETPTATSVPEPFGRPGGPGLWHVKGMMLPYYIQHVAHDLLEAGSASSVSSAIQMAVGIVRKWSQGIPVGGETKVGKKPGHPGHIHPDVQAAASDAMAQWEAKRAKAHAQAAANAAARRDHSMTHTEEIDLAGVTPTFTGNSGYGSVPRRRQEHVHRGGDTTGGMMDIAEMTGKQVRHHMSTMHAQDVQGKNTQALMRAHNGLHKQKSDNPPKRDNSTMSRSKMKPARGRPPGAGPQMRGGPGPGGVGTGEANTGYPALGPNRRQTARSTAMGTDVVTAPDSGPKTGGGKHTAPSGSNVTGLQPPPREIAATMKVSRVSGANRQTQDPNFRDPKPQKQTGISRQQRSPNIPDARHVPATPSSGQIQGTSPPPGAVRTAAQAKRADKATHSYSQTYDPWGNVVDLAVTDSSVPSPNAATRKAALKKGEALPHESGSPGRARFPLTNRVLASRAVHMVQLAKGDKPTIRRYIMRTLRSKGWADLIPDNWNADGTTS